MDFHPLFWSRGWLVGPGRYLEGRREGRGGPRWGSEPGCLGLLQATHLHVQKDAEGNIVKTTCWWDGQFLKTRMEGGRRGVVETWRSVDAGLMLVKTTLKPTAGREVSVIFYLEEMSIPGRSR
jgi:hypothetical protein